MMCQKMKTEKTGLLIWNFVINACIEAYATQESEILEDAYSVNNNITMENETLCYDREVCRNKSQCPVKDNCVNRQ